MFQPMAFTFGFAVLGAIILCLTYVPMVSALLLKPVTGEKNWFNRLEDKIEQGSTWLIDKIHRGYHPIISRSLNNKEALIFISLIMLAGTGSTFACMGGIFNPDLYVEDIAI